MNSENTANKSDNGISDNDLLDLWRSPTFEGSYRGIKTFQVLLKTNLNLDISQRRLYRILKSDPIFLIHQKPHRNFERRHYDLNNYGELVQADIAYMFEFNGFRYFLLVVDCFSSKVFTLPLANKDSKSVANAFGIIFEQFGAKIYEIQTDRGKEFFGPCKVLFQQKQILYRTKLGKNKANFAEHSILIVKRKLYMLLRGILSQDWIKFLPQVTESLNNTPLQKLGWLKPNSIKSEIDSVKVKIAQKEHNINVYEEPNFHTQRENQQTYELNSKNLQLNDYVYLNFEEKIFDKSFNVSVFQIAFKKTQIKNIIVSFCNLQNKQLFCFSQM